MDSQTQMERIQSLARGKGVQHIVDAAYEILGNPMIVIDTSYQLLTCTKDIVTDDPYWNEIVSLGHFSHEAVDFFNSAGFIQVFSESEVVSIMKHSSLQYDRINGKLFDKDNVQLGNITVIALEKPFDQESPMLIEAICEILSLELQNSEFYAKIERVYQESIIDRLLSGQAETPGDLPMRDLYENLKANLYLAVIDITQYERTVTHLAYFRDLFRRIQSEHHYFIHLNYIVAILSTDDLVLHIEKDIGKLSAFFEQYKIYAGISSCFSAIVDLPVRLREALNALNYGLKSNRARHIFKFDSYRLEHFLHSIKDNVDINKMLNPIVLLIQAYDKEHGTALLDTLYAYLLNTYDPSLTSATLGIPESVLRNQLQTLEALFDVDWKDASLLQDIFLSIKMLDG